MVVERIHAINDFNDELESQSLPRQVPALVEQPHPVLTAGEGGEWLGSRVTLQRWFIDPLVDRDGIDRGLCIVFTHDHYGPSTFQQVGLYSTLLAEPAESTWRHNETGDLLGTRGEGCLDPSPGCDGGPTSWQAVIEPAGWSAAQGEEPFREFYFEFSDFQHAYEAGVYVGAGTDGRPFDTELPPGECNEAHDPDCHVGGVNQAFPVTADTFRHAINPSFRQQAICKTPAGGLDKCPAADSVTGESPFPDIVRFPSLCPGGVDRPCPEAINADDAGMLVVNYRNEPIGLRVFDPVAPGPDGNPGTQTAGFGGDLAFALATPPLLGPDAVAPVGGQPAGCTDENPATVCDFRAIPQMNTQPVAGTMGALAVGGADFYAPNESGLTTIDTEFPPPLNEPGALIEGDPFTPLVRAFPGDKVKIKVQAGAHEHEHNASLHGLKWVQGNSGFGPQRPSGGWRNSQNIGISEQFNFSMPLNGDPQAKKPFQHDPRRGADYVYAVDSAQDGWWSGMWGLIRSYTGGVPADAPLYQLPGGFDRAPVIDNRDQFNGVCPIDAPLREYEVVAVAANEILDNSVEANVSNGKDGEVELKDAADELHVGGSLDANGGTLVYNPRGTGTIANGNGFRGPLHDPTGLMFVLAQDLEPNPPADQQGGACGDVTSGQNQRPGVANPACQVRLKPTAPLEPLVLRAAAGDCVEARLYNRLTDNVPDLAGFNTLLQMVIRDRKAQQGQIRNPADPENPFVEQFPSVTTFNNNLVRPSSYVGLHAQMLEYDVTQHDGVVAGGNVAGGAVVGPAVGGLMPAAPFNAVTYRWYAGHLEAVVNGNGVNLEPTPVEFGGSNLSPADKIKQGQKGMIGALVVEPQNATWPGSGEANDLAMLESVPNRQGGVPNRRGTRADMLVSDIGGAPLFEDLVLMKQSALNHRYKDGEAVPNIASEGQGIPEDSHDAGQKGVNFGTEPAWFRFGLPADVAFGNAGTAGSLGAVAAEEMFANVRTGGADPWTPVFTAAHGQPARMRVLQSMGVGRGSTFDLHGHPWQRDPYLPETPGCLTAPSGLGDGKPLNAGGSGCGLSSVSIGHNPLAWYLGGQESWSPQGHFDIVLPSVGGRADVDGDFLFRDHASFGVTDGIWGILRASLAAPPDPCADNQAPTAVISGPTSGGVNQRLRFDGRGSSDPEGEALTYAWEFGDAGTSTSARPSHRYRAVGSYIVRLTVTETGACVASSAPAMHTVVID
jgi:hypothetical protein